EVVFGPARILGDDLFRFEVDLRAGQGDHAIDLDVRAGAGRHADYAELALELVRADALAHLQRTGCVPAADACVAFDGPGSGQGLHELVGQGGGRDGLRGFRLRDQVLKFHRRVEGEVVLADLGDVLIAGFRMTFVAGTANLDLPA